MIFTETWLGLRQFYRTQSGGPGDFGLFSVQRGKLFDGADGTDGNVQQVERSAHLARAEPAGQALSLGKNGALGHLLAQQFASNPVLLKNGQATGNASFADFASDDFLAEPVSEFEFLKVVEQDGLALLLDEDPCAGAERLSQVQSDQEAGVVIDSHRRLSMMTWLPGFPGAGLPSNMASTFDQVSVQSTGAVPRSAGTILATARLRRTTRISWPRATTRSRSGKVDCACSTVTVFMLDKVVAASALGKDGVRRCRAQDVVRGTEYRVLRLVCCGPYRGQ
jgi:hypothetical protein